MLNPHGCVRQVGFFFNPVVALIIYAAGAFKYPPLQLLAKHSGPVRAYRSRCFLILHRE